jgi:cellulose synthase/poly-beta-1,6-N-acetylglucosamine synthase-like glycosyltransferase
VIALLAAGLLICVALVLAVPVFTLLTQALAALPPRPVGKIPVGPRPRVAVLVPAHDEQHAIGMTLASVGRQLVVGDRLVVVVDNCTDDTAGVVRRIGAEVTVRTDPLRRGKGYALDHGLDFLEQSGAPDIVIFIDADCRLGPSCIERLALLSARSGRPVQAAYLMNPPRTAQKTAAMVSFAWTVKDFVRPLGWHRLGLPCMLAGSGMAFPWQVIRRAHLASGELAEDLKLSLDLALGGVFAQFHPEAVVISDVAVGGRPSESQRARWEHGTLALLLRYLPRLLARLCRSPNRSLLAAALDLSVPPLALLTLMLGTELALALAFLLVSGMAAPILAAGAVAAAFFFAIVLAWWGYGRTIIPLRWLVFAPVYAALKLPLYGRFLLNRQRLWVRGAR